MTQAEVPQPISGIPMRWGGLTGQQLGWFGIGAILPYLLLRLRVPPELALLLSGPWIGTAVTLAFGRREGRRLDAWISDWIWFQTQPHRLLHPALQDHLDLGRYQQIDASARPSPAEDEGGRGSLPWVWR
ncbi:MAG TPA: PrgI family protein [Candidatus Dormibacteraeota bacterium]